MRQGEHDFRLIVSFEYPHRIIATEVASNEFLGYLDVELHGHSLMILFRLSTDIELTLSAISEAAMLRSTTISACLRNKEGLNQMFSMSTFPFRGHEGTLVGCMILFGSNSSTAMRNCCNSIPTWTSDSPSSEPFCLDHDHNYFTRDHASSHSQERSCQVSLLVANCTRATANCDNQDASSTVLPRKRCGDRPNPVVVTATIIQTLQSLPIHKAADVVGISVTALKRACRRLGVHRWPYHRGSPKPTSGQPGRCHKVHKEPQVGCPVGQSAESLAESFLLDRPLAPIDDLFCPSVLPLTGGPSLDWPEPAQAGPADGTDGAALTPPSGCAAGAVEFPDLDGSCERTALGLLLQSSGDDLDDSEFANWGACTLVNL
jgi:hypothetical protein